jgi:hypothetical protein
MAWTRLPVETDPDVVTARLLTAMAARMPGWVPVEGAPEVVLAEEIGRETAATNARAAAAADLAFAGIGQSVFGLSPLLGSQAVVLVELAVTGAGAVVPQGFTVVGVNPAGVEVAFELPGPVTSTGATVQVLMRAREVGAAANDIAPGPLTVVTATATVSTAAAVAASDGGVDAESLEAYLSRLIDYIATLRPGGVRAADLATLARNVVGVHRALGVDLYDASTDTHGVERTATVFPIDLAGDPVDTATAAAVEQLLEDVREVNFDVHVAEPTYTPVQVTFTAVAETGADPAQVQANVHAALAAFLSPALWGTTAGDTSTWSPVDQVRYLDLARVAGSADGVAYLTALTLNGTQADVTLPGPAPLPASLTALTPSTITGTVS